MVRLAVDGSICLPDGSRMISDMDTAPASFKPGVGGALCVIQGSISDLLQVYCIKIKHRDLKIANNRREKRELTKRLEKKTNRIT